jgi:hypothetical protein
VLTPAFRAAAVSAGLAIACIAVAPAPAATDRPVFVCRNSTPVIYSDRPCGPLAETCMLRLHDHGPGLAPSVELAIPREATRPLVEPRDTVAKPVLTRDLCRRLRVERR